MTCNWSRWRLIIPNVAIIHPQEGHAIGVIGIVHIKVIGGIVCSICISGCLCTRVVSLYGP